MNKFTILISKHAQDRNLNLGDKILQWIYDNIHDPEKNRVTVAFNESLTCIIFLQFNVEEDYNLFKLCFGKDVILEEILDDK